MIQRETIPEQECIPVGCVPPACWPYPSMHCRGGVPAQGGVRALGGVRAQGGYLPRGVVYLPRGVTCPGGVVYLPGGVPARGCTCPGGCTYPGGGVPAWGVYLPGGVPARGCTCQGEGTCPGGTCPGTPPLWTEWQTGAKILPCPKLRLRAVITYFERTVFQIGHTHFESIVAEWKGGEVGYGFDRILVLCTIAQIIRREGTLLSTWFRCQIKAIKC